MEAITRSRYHQGVNSVSVHWNYILIKIKKSTLNNIKNGSIGAAGYLAGKFKKIYVAIAASAIVGVLSANSIKGGMWFRVHTYVYTALEGLGVAMRINKAMWTIIIGIPLFSGLFQLIFPDYNVNWYSVWTVEFIVIALNIVDFTWNFLKRKKKTK